MSGIKRNNYIEVSSFIICLNTKLILACVAIVVAMTLITAPSVIDNDAFAGKKSKGISQWIKQSESNKESSKITSSGDIKNSGNNKNIQTQNNNKGNTASQ